MPRARPVPASRNQYLSGRSAPSISPCGMQRAPGFRLRHSDLRPPEQYCTASIRREWDSGSVRGTRESLRPRRNSSRASLIFSNLKFQRTGPVSKRWKFACIFLASALLAGAAVAQQVLTESGAISGIRANGLNVYKGIPFAAPPVGDLRWSPPVHAATWTGTRKADAFAPACMQVGVSMPAKRLQP